ncbi:MAG: single-stranded DNA-binding protein [Defluviitaleaceae bacterium]|nr:single-stranded DNA-binding protein [Defluviitaleaceae bacterium]
MQNNYIAIAGKLETEPTFSHEVYGEGFYNFYTAVDRLSETYDILPVTISERLIDIKKLEIGKDVIINGQMRSYNSYDPEEGRNRLILTVFTKNISFSDELFENPNEVILNGYICKPPIFRTTPFGREIADILLAVNRSYNKSDYIPCIAWGRNARYVSNLGVGENIKIHGRMQSRGYQKKLDNGEMLEKVAFEVSINKIEELVDL